MNPFIAFDYEGAHFKTKVAKDGGRNPHFGQEFEIRVRDMHHELKFIIMDEKMLKSVVLGWGIIKFMRLCHNYGILEWVPIFHD